MLRFQDLQQNPVSVTLRDKYGAVLQDKGGAVVTVVAERLRKGAVKITCRCQEYLLSGWCRHCLAVFADPAIFADGEHREAFEKIVKGTFVEAAAIKMIQALEAFSAAYGEMKRFFPKAIDGKQLRTFANRATDASQRANSLAEAVAEFAKKASGDIRAREERADRVSTSFVELKKVFEDVRKTLIEGKREPLLNIKSHRSPN
jgi:hypothetical protein